MASETCGNCAGPLSGAYCAACGQKRLGPGDRSLAHLLAQAFGQLTEVDGKLLRSLRLLLFRPGLLSREYMDDRRVRYTAPLSLFLLANVLYFFSPAMSDFNLPFVNQVSAATAVASLDPAAADYAAQRQRIGRDSGQLHSRWTGALVARKLAARRAIDPDYDLRRLARDYDAQAGSVGKAMIIVHVPIIALALAAVYWRRRRWFAEHFVVALHDFTFLLLFAQLLLVPLNWLANRVDFELPPPVGRIIALALLGVVLGYFLLACRKAYRCGWGMALAGLVALVAGLLVANVVVYRALQFLVTLALA